MTLEEATEVILNGHAFRECLACDSSGCIEIPVYDARLGVQRPVLRTRMCTICKGTTLAYRDEYVEACQVLDRPLPPQRWEEMRDLGPIKKTSWQRAIDYHAEYPIQKNDPDE